MVLEKIDDVIVINCCVKGLLVIERVMGVCIGFKFFIYLINDKCLFCDIFCIVRNVSLLINDR